MVIRERQGIAEDTARARKAPVHPVVSDRLDGLFGGLSARKRVAASQLPVTLTILLVVIAAAIFSPETLASNLFQAALLFHLAIAAASAAIPWARLPAAAFAVIPMLDCVAIGFTREAGGPSFNVLSMMLVFPVIWLSAQVRPYMPVLAIAGTILSAVVPSAVQGSPPAGGSMIRTLILPLVMSVIAVTSHVVATTIRLHRTRLVENEHDLARTLGESLRRQSLLDAVLKAVGVGVWVVDAKGNTVLANRAMQADPILWPVIQPANVSDPAGGPGLLTAADRSTPVAQGQLPAARAAAGEAFTDELYWAGPADRQRAYSVSSHSFPPAGGQEGGAVITFVDVTSLIGALAAKDNFVATVSHELRTPLTSILGYLELVLDEPGHEEIKEELLVVRRNAEHLLNLVNDLIAVASERVELSREETDLARLLAVEVDAALPKAAGNGLQLVLEAEQPLPAKMDPKRIRQVIQNLLSNAIKYSPQGGLITAKAYRTEEGLVCSITDTGLGMTEEEQEQAFTKFFRSARSRETAIPGAGLGLPVSKTIIEGHGGTISLDSEPGAGTTATFILPES
ncbi:signal transduction histidine kinase [Pseudarthrobacter defluvii]|uniref:sensor histidine kinase n=1 Tax=Pseudarthrobacter defluvii TaxID=410837 RepID=UPI00278A0311|nr:HAMP domain-containing sensor histidine kinase [Pseudarthrobacter defluvii]MDQ0771035.1 signal transduction histidine kinase [Pseudarthrobacter defluvii]